MKSTLFIVLIVICNFEVAFADSPLTSTHFSDAYKEVPIVIKASKANGQLTPELMEYIVNKTNPIDIKVAVINKLSWDHEAKNAEIFFNYLKEEKFYTDHINFLNTGTGSDLLCYAYLKSLDDYFDVKDALNFARAALQKETKSFTYNIVTSLIEAQYLREYDGCEVYRIPDSVRRDSSLVFDMRIEAVKQIYAYTDLYVESCNEERNPKYILPKDFEGEVINIDNERSNEFQKYINEKWKSVENPINLTFLDISVDGTFHLYFSDSVGTKYDLNGNNNLGEIRLYGPATMVANPYYIGKMFKITWELKLSEHWIFYEDWEKVIAMMPSIVNIELIKN